MIVDCHVHLNNYHEEHAVSLDDSLARLQDAMGEAAIDYALVLTSYIVSPNRPSTAAVVEAVARVDNLGVVAGISYLNYRHRDLRELADYLAAGLVKGLKLYPGYEPFYPSDTRMQAVYALAEEFDVPVMIHCGDTYTPKGKVKYSHPLQVDDVAVDFPKVKFVICHLGNPWLVDCMEVVYKNANVHADISGLVLGEFTAAFEDYMADEIEDVILYAGDPSRFLFGTDWPICSMKSYVDFVQEIELTPEARQALMYENARRLFKLPLPAEPVPGAPISTAT
ncbi:MAG: amidohydrolase family protein [Gemmatimonadales bacterium]